MPEHAPSTIGLQSMQEVDSMHGKSFVVYQVNFLEEPEIAEAFSIQKDNLPEIICIKNKKVHKRQTGPLYSNQILELLK